MSDSAPAYKRKYVSSGPSRVRCRSVESSVLKLSAEVEGEGSGAPLPRFQEHVWVARDTIPQQPLAPHPQYARAPPRGAMAHSCPPGANSSRLSHRWSRNRKVPAGSRAEEPAVCSAKVSGWLFQNSGADRTWREPCLPARVGWGGEARSPEFPGKLE